MSSELKLSGTTARVILQGNDSISSDQTFTFPDTGGEVVTSPAGGSVVGYQQGTWDLNLRDASDGDYQVDINRWTRIGNTINIWGRVSNLVQGDKTGMLIADGWPYSPVNYGFNSVVGTCYTSRIGGGANLPIVSVVWSFTNPFRLIFYGNNGVKDDPSQSLQWQYVGADGLISFSATYLTDDTTWTPLNGATVS